MGLLDEVAVEATAHRPAKCVVGRWLGTLDKKSKAEIDEVLGSQHPWTALYRVIVRHYGRLFAERTFTKHLEGKCCCVSSR